MQPESVTTWAQLAVMGVLTVAAIVWSVGQLFKTMGNTYGGIISALQHQNAEQEKRLDSLKEEADKLRHRVSLSDRECDEKIKAISARVADVEQKTS